MALENRAARTPFRVIEGSATRAEAREAWGRVRVLSNRVHLAVVAERPDIALASAGELSYIANRRLRQLGPEDAA